jgi:protein-tyrosine-phosphatase
MNLLFVCRYNRFRSVMAEAFFKKYNTNPSIHVRSAAPIRGGPQRESIIKAAKEFNLTIKRSPSGLTAPLMRWQDVTVVVADDVPAALFDKNKKLGKRVIAWNIRDAQKDTVEERIRITRIIKKKVLDLVKELA